jgi:chorismate mutase
MDDQPTAERARSGTGAGPAAAAGPDAVAGAADGAGAAGRSGDAEKAGAAEAGLAGHEEALARLRSLRGSIDNLDAALIHLLAERFTCTQQVGELKAAHHLPPADPAREAAQIARLRRLAADARLDPAFAEKFLNFIVDEVVRHHRAIAARPRQDGSA